MKGKALAAVNLPCNGRLSTFSNHTPHPFVATEVSIRCTPPATDHRPRVFLLASSLTMLTYNLAGSPPRGQTGICEP